MFNSFDAVDYCTTDANFRSIGLLISNGIQLHLRKTPDPGQINWNTVLRPTTSWTSVGYEMYAFKDALQSQQPLFMKVLYGFGGSYATPPMGLNISLGTGSDGNGNLTGQFLNTEWIQSSQTPFNGNSTHFVCGGDDRLVIITGQIGPNTSSASYPRGIRFSIERSKNGLGQNTTEGYYVIWNGIGNTSSTNLNANNNNIFAIPGKTTYKMRILNFVTCPNSGQSGVDGNVINAAPVRMFTTCESSVCHNVIGYKGNDFPNNALITITCHDGIARLYRTLDSPYTSTMERGYGEGGMGNVMYRVD